MAYFPNPISAHSIMLAIGVLKIATNRDLLHTIYLWSLQNMVVYIMACAVYSNIHYSPLCIAGQLSCILRLECKHIIRRAKLGQIQGGLQRAIQDSTKGGLQ